MKNSTNFLVRFSKGILLLCSLMVLTCIFMFFLNSCNSEETIEDKHSKEFISSYNILLDKFSSMNIVNNITKSRVSIDEDLGDNQLDETILIYLLYPKNTQEDIKNLTEEVVTIQDLSDLIRLTDAVLQYQPNNENIKYKIEVSKASIMNGINPMIKTAKEYLYSRGFSEEEIQMMIEENNAQESDLIPFVLKLSEASISEESNQKTPTSQLKTNFSSILFTPLYAEVPLNSSDYQSCALEAIGFDIAYSLAWSGAKTWGKIAIKKAFTTIAKRALGPVGAAIAVVEFGICLNSTYRAKNSGNCIYAIPTPSDIEKSYDKLINLQ